MLVSVADGDGDAIGPDDVLYLVSRRGAPRGRILSLPLDDLALSLARTLIAQGDGVIQGGGESGGVPVVVHRDPFYLRELVGGLSRVAIFGDDGTPKEEIALPPIAAVDELEPAALTRVLYGVQT